MLSLDHLSQIITQLLASNGWLVYGGLFLIILAETGLVVTPFLPGDSLLFLSGSIAAMASHPLNVWYLLILVMIAAILGDTINFAIGTRFGVYLTRRHPDLIKPKYRVKTEEFFMRHGNLAIFWGRFIPVIRTIIPFTAGMGSMPYRTFISYNVLGGIVWALLGIGAGWFFGGLAVVRANFDLIIVAIILISLLPVVFTLIKDRREVA